MQSALTRDLDNVASSSAAVKSTGATVAQRGSSRNTTVDLELSADNEDADSAIGRSESLRQDIINEAKQMLSRSKIDDEPAATKPAAAVGGREQPSPSQHDVSATLSLSQGPLSETDASFT